MELIANEKSIHEQFHDIELFRKSLRELMRLRGIALRNGKTVRFHSQWYAAKPMPGLVLQQAVSRIPNRDEQTAFLTCLDREQLGDMENSHSFDHRLSCYGESAIGTAIGEAATRIINGLNCGLVSVSPSAWTSTPIKVIVGHGNLDGKESTVLVSNWWKATDLEQDLVSDQHELRSWYIFERVVTTRYDKLFFGTDCFTPLYSLPFADCSSRSLMFLLDVLNQMAHELNSDGSRTENGWTMYNNFFVGENALFSDSSDSEKSRMGDRMEFSHPSNGSKTLHCTWHGKERHLKLRLHFSWPPRLGEPIYVMYIGLHLT